MGATAPGRPYAPPGPALAMKWRHPDQSRAALAAHGASRRQVEPQRTGTHGATTRYAAAQGLMRAPKRAGP
jgi:hypothetical protein